MSPFTVSMAQRGQLHVEFSRSTISIQHLPKLLSQVAYRFRRTLNVSFFSTEKYQGSTPQIAGIDRATKLHDIEEVPIYTSSDENKMLTIMSNGSLAWLLANESFVVPEEGGEEGGGNVIAGTLSKN